VKQLAYLIAVTLIAVGIVLVATHPAERLNDIIPADCPGCTAIPRSIP
jgi:hypothetical protein